MFFTGITSLTPEGRVSRGHQARSLFRRRDTKTEATGGQSVSGSFLVSPTDINLHLVLVIKYMISLAIASALEDFNSPKTYSLVPPDEADGDWNNSHVFLSCRQL